jgi:hypothetical protein
VADAQADKWGGALNREGETEEGMWSVRGLGWISLPSNKDFSHRNGLKYFRVCIAFQGIPIVSYRANRFIPVIAHFWTALTHNGGIMGRMAVLIP